MAASEFTLADYQALAQGVGTIGTGAYYASVHYLYGSSAAIAVDSGNSAMVVAATYGSGRVMQLGHGGMLYANLSTPLGLLLGNAAKWMARGRASGVRLAGSESGITNSAVKGLVALVSE